MTAPDELCRLSVVELAARVRRRALSPLEIVDAHIHAILAWNPIINAVVANRFEAARKEARAQAETLVHVDADDLPPLFGVPFTVKESLGIEGMPQSAGSVLRKGRSAPRTAPVVRRLIDAGAIPLGVTNVPEMAMWTETDNLVYGRTNNPWDPSRIAGGSSGGEAAVVGAGASPFGIATDVGGSIRMPALFCGVFGHKGSGGLVPSTGHIPLPSPRAARLLSTGALCRSAVDLEPILRVIAGPDGEDPGCDGSMRMGAVRDVLVERLTVHVVRDDGRNTPTPAMRASQARAAAALEARGARVVETEIPELKDAFQIWADTMKRTTDKSFERWLGEENAVDLVKQLALLPFGKATHTLPSLAFLALERLGEKVNIVRGGHEKGLALKEKMRALLGHDGVLLFPTFPRTAPRHGEMLRAGIGFVLSGVWSSLEVCSTQVPLGFDGEHLPTGVQVIGSPGSDAVTIAVAVALEQDLGGWRPPPRRTG